MKLTEPLPSAGVEGKKRVAGTHSTQTEEKGNLLKSADWRGEVGREGWDGVGWGVVGVRGSPVCSGPQGRKTESRQGSGKASPSITFK